MSLLQRYRSGEHLRVWEEIRQGQELTAEVRAVVDETVDRIAANARRLVALLEAEDYEFEDAPLRPSPATLRTDLARVGRMCGDPPYLLRRLWEMLGGVDLRGTHPGWRGTGFAGRGHGEIWATDPLVIEPLDFASAEADFGCWLELRRERSIGPFVLTIGADALHKSNISGGVPYGILTPSDPVEGRLRLDQGVVEPFLDYLRRVFQWAGFPGLEEVKDPPLEMVARWCEGLEAF